MQDATIMGVGHLYHFCDVYEKADEFLSALISSDRFTPKRVTDTLGLGKNRFIFRGHADLRWELLPATHRGSIAASEVARRAPQPLWDAVMNDEKGRRDALGSYLFEELLDVERFLRTADRLGLNTPVNFEHFRLQGRIYRQLWKDLNEQPWLDSYPDPDLYSAFAMAQHYGVPTRFLDWTESPLVAAYFAAYGAWRSLCAPKIEHSIVAEYLAVVPMPISSAADRGIVIVEAPRAHSSFLLAQKGIFTLVPRANAYWWCETRWPSLHDLDASRFTPMVLPIREAVPLLRLLFSLDITPHHMMPTLQNAARAVRYADELFSDRRAES